MELGLYPLPLISLLGKPASGDYPQFLCPLATVLHGYELEFEHSPQCGCGLMYFFKYF